MRPRKGDANSDQKKSGDRTRNIHEIEVLTTYFSDTRL
jgi:hypothetical protein